MHCSPECVSITQMMRLAVLKTNQIAVDSEFKDRLAHIGAMVQNALEAYLRQDPDVPTNLTEAMLYSVQAGGKRLRPSLVVLACQACGGAEATAVPAAAAIEMIHTYSLIHDDLPAMDDDDFRRGRPSNHKVFGDGMAVLAGDALLTYAFNVLARHVPDYCLARRLVLELSQAAGAAGMIGGQVADLHSPNSPHDLETLNYIHAHKTAMLFRAAARMGALSAVDDADKIDTLGEYGLKLGLAFQIIDDLLDATGDADEMGKATGKDAQIGKLTYPSIVGLEESRLQADAYIEQALSLVKPFGPPADPLRDLAVMAANRAH